MRRNFLRKVGGEDFGSAVSFDGISQYASLPFTINSSTFTMSAWINTNDSNSSRFLGLNSNLTNWIDYRAATNIINLRNASGGVSFNFPSVNAGVWSHVYVSGNAGTSRVFLNGVESTSGAQSVAGNFNFDQIAYTGAVVGFFQAILDDLVIHNAVAANPATEAALLYNGGVHINPLTIIPLARQYYNFNNNYVNLGTLGGSATPFNSPTFVPHV